MVKHDLVDSYCYVRRESCEQAVADLQGKYPNIKALLESEGADWHDIVRTTCYLADFRTYDEFNEARNAFYEEEQLDPLPASTCIEARICRPELLVEIEAIAILG